MKTEQERLNKIARKSAYMMFSPASHNAVMAFDIIGLAITEALAPVVKERDELKADNAEWEKLCNIDDALVSRDDYKSESTKLRADNERLREKINEVLSCIGAVRNNNDKFHAWAFAVGTLNEALNPTPTKETT